MNVAADFHGPERSAMELAERKRIADRAVLLDHVDRIIRPPGWVYDEIEEAIRHALAGNHTAKIDSRDGSRYDVADLLERWELEELLERARGRTGSSCRTFDSRSRAQRYLETLRREAAPADRAGNGRDPARLDALTHA